jgi:hypothetical protein
MPKGKKEEGEAKKTDAGLAHGPCCGQGQAKPKQNVQYWGKMIEPVNLWKDMKVVTWSGPSAVWDTTRGGSPKPANSL